MVRNHEETTKEPSELVVKGTRVNSATFGLVGWVSLICMVLGTGAATRIFIVGSARGKAIPAAVTDYATANH